MYVSNVVSGKKTDTKCGIKGGKDIERLWGKASR